MAIEQEEVWRHGARFTIELVCEVRLKPVGSDFQMSRIWVTRARTSYYRVMRNGKRIDTALTRRRAVAICEAHGKRLEDEAGAHLALR